MVSVKKFNRWPFERLPFKFALEKRTALEVSASEFVYDGKFTISNQLTNSNFCVSSLPHRSSTSVSLEPNPLISVSMARLPLSSQIFLRDFLCQPTYKSDVNIYRVLPNVLLLFFFRVEMTLRNSADFAKAYNCPLGSPMNPKDKCAVW